MEEFVDNLIAYLDAQFVADDTIATKPEGHYAYEKGLEPTATTPFYTVELLDYSTQSETFLEETTISTPFQINVYGVKMRVSSVLKNAQEVSFILTQKVAKFMENYKYNTDNVVYMRRTAFTSPIPYEDGSKAYYSVLRYDATIQENE